jgi:carbonic anhydrase
VHTRRRFLIGVPAVVAAAMVVPAGSAALATTPRQSPIRIRSHKAVSDPDLPDLVVDYPDQVDVHVHYVRRDQDAPDGCSVRDHEEVVEAEVPAGAAAVELDGVRYELIQFHFHTPSEHVLDGRRFPVEQHFVHRGPDGQTLVLGLFLSAGGRGDRLQDAVLHQTVQECGEEFEVSGDLAGALPSDLSTFRYDGSLTTAPYTEGVSWLVLKEPVRVGRETLERYQRLFPDGNAREVQPLNDRVVMYYREQY